MNCALALGGHASFYLSRYAVIARIHAQRAHSKTVLRVHGMDEVGVRFPVGPHYKYKMKLPSSSCAGEYVGGFYGN